MSNMGWDDVTVVGSKARVGGGGPRATVARSQAEINAAKRSGAVLSVEKKYTTGNKTASSEGQRLTKIDRENEVAPPAKISMDVGRALQKARQDKNLTQKDLATRVNEKPTVINDYEAGRAVPNQQLLAKIERVVGVKLRGKDIGAPLGGPKKK
ncbi:Mbf1p [Sugiyamaella lignohabitans]|uniref:Mbf1p n=1 Tax=Sugiyamaella lignohabitans TaxID=796027 RepID=A0A167DWU2_9ASCO|nr:Mbf1p [Sugiyamaella lignohabitans]ANB13389.1 Mbf1p [Sugiyamaella lignohabitans]